MKCGVLLINLGTPDAPTIEAIRRYLKEFLSDRRVVDLPRFIWNPILYGFILPLRPRMLAPLYAGIWRSDGSPLLVHTRAQRDALESQLMRTFGEAVPVAAGMRYGQPDVASALAQLQQAGVTRLVVLPMYPQYSATTTAAGYDAVEAALAASRWTPEMREISDYHGDAGYIAALAASVREHWARHGRAARLLMSFHGLPQRYVDAGDPYQRQCQATAQKLAQALALKDGDWLIGYQSRVGKARWLTPYTDVLMRTLPGEGVRSLDVICPGFSADCLETLDEIAKRYAAQFVAAGGEALRYVPALNAQPAHIEALARIVAAQLA